MFLIVKIGNNLNVQQQEFFFFKLWYNHLRDYFAAITNNVVREILNAYNMPTIPLRERKTLYDNLYGEIYFVKKVCMNRRKRVEEYILK